MPIVLGTFVLSEHVAKGETIFNAVFFVVLVSALLQGTTLERVAGALGLLEPHAAPLSQPLQIEEGSPLDLVEFDVAATTRSRARTSGSSDCRGARSSP